MSSFTSFVDYVEKPHVAATNQIPVASTSECGAVEKNTIELLMNEIVSSSCDDVSFSMQFGESEQGQVICTKVRLRFIPIVSKERDVPQRSKFFDDFYDVPLTAIAKIEVAMVKGSNKGKPDKFHRIEYNLSSMETVSVIRLILKDMRVVTIDLRRSQNGTHLANQILFFSKSGPIEKMTQVGAAMEDRGQKAKIPYNGYDAWHAELQRCQQKTDSSSNWNILALHKEGFNYAAQGYPMYVVVSNFLARNDIERQLQHYKQGRFPIWVWSRANGNSSLFISADHENNVATPEISAKVQESISRCHLEKEKPHIIKLDSEFVSNVGKAFDNLLNLCAIDSYEQYVSRQSNWNTKVHRTGWLHLVKSCLQITYETVRWVVDRDRSVILQEEEGKDLSIVVASLTQICCDPFYRTTTGLQQLIEKMWIALGHPFGERLLGRDDDTSRRGKAQTKTPSSKTDVMPTWLLFLDCIAQLHRIYTFEFTFSPHVLISLWDLSLTGMVPSMTCNNLEEQLVARVGGGPFPLDRYYEKSYSKMFGNIWHDSVLFMESIKKNQPVSPHSKFLQCEFIRPPTAFCDIHLWSECYLRWILPANGRNSGKLSDELALDEKMIELAKKWKSSEWRRHVELPDEYSSAYPYSIPEISRPIIDLNDSEINGRNDDFDSISFNSTFNSMSFANTPVHNNTTTESIFDQSTLEKRNRRIAATIGSESPVISMRPKEQIVGFSKYAFDETRPHSRTIETPILENSSTTFETPYRPTPARRSNTVRGDDRPIPPPRPVGLTPIRPEAILRVHIDRHSDDTSPTSRVTRF
ncbi:hypothetical protein GCK72_000810 [Caenorhabditis remanei]|uniref:Myotubularin phosphatase domain-containing protein n=1 Tax=Caenorhabditis remanei TaxID=31234 RepID=A0A6A5HRN2_CAERE|nr:hypothetical protein GCK72_000810 [Caenorhabditis remanei]KAF1768997.1 hypothetical protein GCK72_000810 [Caenorhabditis remanei]